MTTYIASSFVKEHMNLCVCVCVRKSVGAPEEDVCYNIPMISFEQDTELVGSGMSLYQIEKADLFNLDSEIQNVLLLI